VALRKTVSLVVAGATVGEVEVASPASLRDSLSQARPPGPSLRGQALAQATSFARQRSGPIGGPESGLRKPRSRGPPPGLCRLAREVARG